MSEENLSLQTFEEMKKRGKFDISVCDTITDIEANPRFEKLSVTSGQKAQLSALVSQLPAVMGTAVSSSVAKSANTLYLVNCPLGIENTFTLMKNGNYATFLRDGSKFIGYAPISPVTASPVSAIASAQTVVMGTFAAMAVISGQHYLTKINSELDRIRQGTDKILEFLYGDKKAELISEVSFTKYAYENFASIMGHSEQQAGTIVSLQNSRKIAMKDTEFYISDLVSTLQDESDIKSVVYKSCSIYESLELSMQLGVMASLLEVYYSRNYDREFLNYLENDISLYIDKCDKMVLGAFSKLYERVENYKPLPTKKINKDKLLGKIRRVIEPLQNGEASSLKTSLHKGLHASENRKQFYISDNGSVYIKAV